MKRNEDRIKRLIALGHDSKLHNIKALAELIKAENKLSKDITIMLDMIINAHNHSQAVLDEYIKDELIKAGSKA